MFLSTRLRAAGLGTGSGLLFLWLASCSSDANTVIPAAPTAGAAGAAAAAGSATAGNGAVSGGGAAGALASLGGAGAGAGGGAGAASAGSSAGGAAGVAAGGAAGIGGSGGFAGSSGAASCLPTDVPQAGAKLSTTGWKAMWNVPCDFTTNGGCDGVKPPEKAFDGKGDTRTSIGDTHIKAGGKFAQVLGDTFTFDMQSCRPLAKMLLFAAAPPNNSGSFDTRDFPGEVKVTVSSDCTTSADGKISGSFGAVVATATEAKPGCQNDCSLPMTITINPPVAAKCVKLELSKVLQLGASQPGIWWAIDELQVFAP